MCLNPFLKIPNVENPHKKALQDHYLKGLPYFQKPLRSDSNLSNSVIFHNLPEKQPYSVYVF